MSEAAVRTTARGAVAAVTRGSAVHATLLQREGGNALVGIAVSHALEELVGKLTGSGEAGSWSASSWSRGPISTLYRPCPRHASSDITALNAEIGAIDACATGPLGICRKAQTHGSASVRIPSAGSGPVRTTTTPIRAPP